MREIVSTVLTGGPCALKSTAMNFLREKLADYGFNVYVAAEAATFLIEEGLPVKAAIAAKNWNAVAECQREIIGFQIENEGRLLRSADRARAAGRSVVLLCDRGIPDSRAYLPEGPEGDRRYDEILSEFGLNPLSAAERYKGVIKLTTAADGARQFYTLENNAARDEPPEEAIRLDRRIERAYLSHPHLRIVDNAGADAEKKKRRVLREVCALLGIPQPIEAEKKYVVSSLLSWADLPVEYACVEIEQAYVLSSDPDAEYRVRRRSQGRNATYYLTHKRAISPGKRFEVEDKIDGKVYAELIAGSREPGCGIIKKTRVSFLWRGQYFELDLFKNLDRPLCLLEIELTDEQQEVILPTFLGPLQEVTGRSEYGNHALSRLVRPGGGGLMR